MRASKHGYTCVFIQVVFIVAPLSIVPLWVFSTTFKTNVGANQRIPDILTCQVLSAALCFLLFLRQVQLKISVPTNHC